MSLLRLAEQHGVSHTYVDATQLDEVERAIRPETRLLWLESPTNPLTYVVDLQALAELWHAYGLLVVVDNTFATPYLQNPLALGADKV